jgi:hypothetical protein
MTKSTRITSFAIQADGSRSFGLDVEGIRVLITAGEERHEAGLALAGKIATLGPEAPERYPAPAAPKPTAPHKPRPEFTVGQRVWCNIHGVSAWCTVTEVGTGRNRGRIKIAGERCWCPAGNFDAQKPTHA